MHLVEGLTGVCSRVLKALYLRSFRTTSSLWFSRELEGARLSDCHTDTHCGEITIEFFEHDKSRLVRWIRRQHAQFPWMYVPEEIEVAKQENHVFVGFLRGVEFVGYIKLGINRTYVHDFGKIVRFPVRDCFIYDTFVLPEYRGRGLAYGALLETMQYMKARSYKRMWCHIEQWNVPSLKLFGRAGFEKAGRVRFTRLFGFSFFIRDGVVPFLSLERFLRRPTPVS